MRVMTLSAAIAEKPENRNMTASKSAVIRAVLLQIPDLGERVLQEFNVLISFYCNKAMKFFFSTVMALLGLVKIWS